jgi:hypothetical protein
MQKKYWQPQIGPQAAAIDTAGIADELLFGGARGGGKTDFLLADFMADVGRGYGAGWCGVLFRRTYPECEEMIARSRELYPSCFKGARYHSQRRVWYFPDGASLRIRAIDQNEDADKFQGHAFTWIGWDELGNWANPAAYHKLKATLRSAQAIPVKRIRATANPGGAGHGWVKQYFAIDRYPLGGQLLRDDNSSMTRMFIKSRLYDNRVLLQNDPHYAERLRQSGDSQIVRAWLDGDWDIIAGAFFSEWSVSRHVIPPIALPPEWTRFIAFDWGSASPFSVGWWAVVGEDLPMSAGRVLPRGALVRYREWYGANDKGEGLKLTAEAVADGIRARQAAGEKINYAIADPSIFRIDGGPSLAERMQARRVFFRAADNNRLAGWDQLRARLNGHGGIPQIYCFADCIDSIRTMPALLHDPQRSEDIDTASEDHIADEWRYACMSRPYAKSAPVVPGAAATPLTWNDLHALQPKKNNFNHRI